MAKKNEQTGKAQEVQATLNLATNAPVENKEVLPSSVGLGLVYDETTKHYNLVTLKFDVNTKAALVDSVEDVGVVRGLAINSFKQATLKHRLFG